MSENIVTPVELSFPEAGSAYLKLGAGACRITVKPGGDAWVTGTYSHPPEALPLKIKQEGGTATITQEYSQAWNLLGHLDNVPTFDLSFGAAQPYMLKLDGGATEGRYDLGGLPITRLEINQGAGQMTFDFSAPNPEAMSLLDVEAGAVDLNLKNLANANCSELRVKGGAAAYKLDFGGVLQRDSHVRIDTGMSGVEIKVPAATAVQITSEALLGHVDLGDGFTRKEGAYWNQAALDGGSPLLTIQANMAVGSLSLRLT